MKRGLARINQQVGQSTLVAFSASANQVSDDGNRGNGLYTQYLLQYLATPNITLTQMFTKVRNGVYKASGGKQHPKEENGLLQEVYLNKTGRVDNGDAERRRQAVLRQQRLQQAQQDKVRQQKVQQHVMTEKIRQQKLKAQQVKTRQQQLQQQSKSVGKTAGRRIGQYIDHGDGTVTDTKTKLMWKKCSEGQSGSNCFGKAKEYQWSNAVQRFKQARFARYNDWRLPVVEELRTLVACSNGIPQQEAWSNSCGRNGGNINFKVFPQAPAWGWSSTPYTNDTRYVWRVSFYSGRSYADYKNGTGTVRLVRSRQ